MFEISLSWQQILELASKHINNIMDKEFLVEYVYTRNAAEEFLSCYSYIK